jgi:hypothetical protein
MKMHFTKMLSVCCAIVFGAFLTTDALAQGSTCETAVAVTPGAYTADGPSDGVSEDPCFTGAGDFADWYTYTPPSNGFITISSCLGGADTQVQVLTGTCGSLSCVDAADDDCPFAEGSSTFASELIEVPVVGGTLYYIEWDNQWEDFGFDWSLTFTENATPDCEGVPGGLAVPGTPCDDLNADTFDDTYQADCSCAGIPFDCPGLGNIGDTCDDGDPTTVGDVVGEDCTCAGLPATGDCLNSIAFGSADLTLAASELVTISFCSFQTEYSTISGVQAGQTYQFAIEEGGYITVRFDSLDGPVVGQGSSPLTISAPADNNLFAHWNTNGACQTATNCVVTTVQCTTCPSTCPDGNPGDPCDDGNPLTEGETIQADCSCAGGIIPVANNDCEDVASLLQCGGSVNGTTVGATATAGLNNFCNGFTSSSPEDVWYAFQANGTSNYTVTVDTNAATSSSLMDAVMFIYSGSCGSLTEIACADENFSSTFTGESITLESPASGIYYVRVFNWNAGGEPFTISLDCESNCNNPFPAVDPASLSTTQIGNGFLTEWGAVTGQIGCQVQARLAGGPGILGAVIVPGVSADSFVIPFNVLQPSTQYQWRVRCGCSQTPLVAGPWSAWNLFTTPGAAISSQPNPTEGQSNVTFTVLEEGYTTLEVFDMSGRLVDAIFTGVAQPNNDYRFEFDGSSLPNGVYIYRLTTENEVVNNKFVIAK